MKLAFTSPDVISTRPKHFLTSRIDFTVLLLFRFLKNFTCLSGKLKTEFTTLITKPTSRRLLDTAFFACCIETKDDVIQISNKILYVLYFFICHYILITYTGHNEITWTFPQKWLKWFTVLSGKYLWNPDYSFQKTTTTNLSCDFPENENL